MIMKSYHYFSLSFRWNRMKGSFCVRRWLRSFSCFCCEKAMRLGSSNSLWLSMSLYLQIRDFETLSLNLCGYSLGFFALMRTSYLAGSVSQISSMLLKRISLNLLILASTSLALEASYFSDVRRESSSSSLDFTLCWLDLMYSKRQFFSCSGKSSPYESRSFMETQSSEKFSSIGSISHWSFSTSSCCLWRRLISRCRVQEVSQVEDLPKPIHACSSSVFFLYSYSSLVLPMMRCTRLEVGAFITSDFLRTFTGLPSLLSCLPIFSLKENCLG